MRWPISSSFVFHNVHILFGLQMTMDSILAQNVSIKRYPWTTSMTHMSPNIADREPIDSGAKATKQVWIAIIDALWGFSSVS